MAEADDDAAPDLERRAFDELLKEGVARQDLLPLAHAVFRQAAKVVAVCSAAFIGTDPNRMSLERNQAICAGLLARAVKFMRAVAVLSADRSSAEVVLALNRCILDTATAVSFLLKKNDPEVFDRFVLHSLVPERELREVILQNVANRGTELPIERRMLDSIGRMCLESGIDVATIPSRVGPWDGGMRQRLEAIDFPNAYAMLQGMPSAAIHGSWSDLLHFHIKKVNGGYAVRFESRRVDVRLFGAAAIILLAAARDYMERYFAGQPETAAIVAELTELDTYMRRVDDADEELRQPRSEPNETSAEPSDDVV